MSRLLYSLFGAAIGAGITYALSKAQTQSVNTNKDNLPETLTPELTESMEAKEDTNESDSDNSGFSEEEYDQFVIATNNLHKSIQRCNDTVAELASHFTDSASMCEMTDLCDSEPALDGTDARPTSAS